MAVLALLFVREQLINGERSEGRHWANTRRLGTATSRTKASVYGGPGMIHHMSGCVVGDHSITSESGRLINSTNSKPMLL